MMKKTLLAMTLSSLCAVAFASGGHGEKPTVNPWSHFALDNAIKAMPAGDATRGAQIHEQMMCNACHGEKGESPSRNYASINGQPEAYTIKMMLDYLDGRRWEDYKQANIMVKISQDLDDQQISDLASFYAQQPLQTWNYPVAEVAPSFAHVDRLVRKGDNSRMLTPCASCHGAHGEGSGIIPAIAGQVPEYFVRTMKAYQAGHRHNDVQQGMSQFTHDLTDEEIQGLANYYATLKQRGE